jgi:ubiquinone/menaquinone biosynthesis C-methylase UbiE
MSTYLMAGQITEFERLRLQAQTLEPEAIAFLRQLGVHEGWKALDVGCGAMGVLGPLVQLVGPSGKVVGTDLDPKLLTAARAYLAEQGLDGASTANIDLIEDNAYATTLPASYFDLTHVRFLFAPAGRPLELMPQLTRVTRPNGIIAAQEPDSASWNVHPHSDAFTRLKSVILEAFQVGGGDFDAGNRLFNLFVDHHLKDVQVRKAIVSLPAKHRYLRVPIMFANSLRQRILDANIISAIELDSTIAEVEAHVAREDVTGSTFTIMQVWGKVSV